jgi:hypothetical protein
MNWPVPVQKASLAYHAAALQVPRMIPIVSTHRENRSAPISYWPWQADDFCEYAIYRCSGICIIQESWCNFAS